MWALRQHLSLTQEEMASELGVRQQTISEWEVGLYRPRGASHTLLSMMAERAGFSYSTGEEGERAALARVGCCGFPGGRRAYYRRFSLAEVQQTFYKLPRRETLEAWRQEAPGGFEFAIKAWQVVTHPGSSPTYRRAGIQVPPEKADRYGLFRPTEEVWQGWLKTLEAARALRARVILFQCPARLTPEREHKENLRRFFRAIQREGFLLAWEPRGSWEEAIIKGLCDELGLVHCADPFEGEPVTGAPWYFRLHGRPRYRHQYTDEELRWLAERWRGQDAYLLFNNSLHMQEDALRFQRLLGKE